MGSQSDNDLTDSQYELLKSELDMAINECESLIEPQKTIFKAILNSLGYILENGSDIRNSVETKPEFQDNVQKLSRLIGIDENLIEQIFDFQKDYFKVMVPVNGDKSSERQVKATLLILTVYYIVYGKEEISSKDLGKHLRWLGTGAHGHVTENIRKECADLIKINGSSKSLSYKININGIQKGKNILKELSHGLSKESLD